MAPLSVGFIDLIDWDYDPDTPYERALGGAQSNLCFLAENLAGLGVDVTLFNNASSTRLVRGVAVRQLSMNVTGDVLGAPDVLIVLNTVESAQSLRQQVPGIGRLIWWGGHSHHEKGVQGFNDPQMRDAWDGFVFKTKWQRDRFVETFGLDPARCFVMRNAISPPFAEALAKADKAAQARPHSALAYTSTPFRGLDVLLDTLPVIRQAQPDTALRVFSSLKVYQADADQDIFTALYERCRTTDGVDYVGSLPKADLAAALSQCSILSYPCTFPETAPTAILEAMAVGCHVVTADAYCLPELTAGHATLVPHGATREAFIKNYAEAVIGAIESARADPQAWGRSRQAQIDHIKSNYLWPTRANQWRNWLANFAVSG